MHVALSPKPIEDGQETLESFVVGNDATALLLHGGNLLVGGSDATVLRVDKGDGTVLDTLNASVPVGAMELIDGELFVGSPLGVVFKGDPVSGGFGFWGTCGGSVPREAPASPTATSFGRWVRSGSGCGSASLTANLR